MRKKQTNDAKILAALDTLELSARSLRRFADKYNEHIDAAVMRGDDARAKQLICQKVGVNTMATQLITLKGNINLGAYTAQVAADLGKIPAAIDGCKGLLSESPNFDKLGKSIQKVFSDMKAPAEEISKLNGILDRVLAPQSNDTISSRLDGSAEFEESDEFKAEWRAMRERVGAKVASETVEKPEQISATGDFDFESLIKEENEKK